MAIKVLPEELADDEDRLRRFEREARTLASLNHPNVAQVFGIDQVDDTCFIAMELVAGEASRNASSAGRCRWRKRSRSRGRSRPGSRPRTKRGSSTAT